MTMPLSSHQMAGGVLKRARETVKDPELSPPQKGQLPFPGGTERPQTWQVRWVIKNISIGWLGNFREVKTRFSIGQHGPGLRQCSQRGTEKILIVRRPIGISPTMIRRWQSRSTSWRTSASGCGPYALRRVGRRRTLPMSASSTEPIWAELSVANEMSL